MDLQEFKNKTAAILAAGADAGTTSVMLNELVDAFTVSTAEAIQLRAALSAAETANATLRQANMDLFLKIPVAAQDDKPGNDTPHADEKPSFDALFADGKLL